MSMCVIQICLCVCLCATPLLVGREEITLSDRGTDRDWFMAFSIWALDFLFHNLL